MISEYLLSEIHIKIATKARVGGRHISWIKVSLWGTSLVIVIPILSKTVSDPLCTLQMVVNEQLDGLEILVEPETNPLMLCRRIKSLEHILMYASVAAGKECTSKE